MPDARADAAAPRARALSSILDWVERAGNRLPDQATIFIALAALTLLASWAAAAAGLTARHPISGADIHALNLLSRDGLQWVFANVVTNFTGFAPLGTVLVAMIGVGVAEKTGLFSALLKATVTAVPRWAITPTVVFAGINSNVASDAGYVILPPLAAMLYASLGRHPLAGIAAAFAGVAAGFSANLLPSTLDPMLAGLTQDASRVLDSRYTVNAACNFYFMFASVFVLTLAAWFISDRWVEPRFGPWRGLPTSPPAGDDPSNPPADSLRLTPTERRGLWAAGASFALTVALIVCLVVPADGVLRDPKTASIDPFLGSLVALIMIIFIIPGLAYGIATRQIRSDRDATKMMSQTMAAMGHYIVMAFFAGQFIAWFRRSNLGSILAIEGADFLRTIGLTGVPLMVGFVLVTAAFNLLMSSASAKWAMLAPIFVPMLMMLGKSPEATQAYYRVGDSVTNCITPLNVYLPILLAAAHRYVPTAGLGTLIAAMIPYSVGFLLIWTLVLVVWIQFGVHLGPASPLVYTPAT